jgi:tetratricopeptide (TPR) repeat protein
VYASKGDNDRAIEYYEKCLEVRVDALGEAHPDVAATYNCLGQVHASKGVDNLAIRCYKKALRCRRAAL